MTRSGTWAKRYRPILISCVSAVCWILIWHFGAMLANRNLLLKIPLPLETLQAFFGNLGKGEFWLAVWTSVLHILAGFLAAAVLGIIGGILSGTYLTFRAVSAPVLHLIRAVPVAAFVILAWLWIPSDILPGIIAGLMVLPIIWGQVDAGTRMLDPRYAEMARVDGMSEWGIAFGIRLPMLEDAILGGCVTGLGIAWKAGVAAEVICNPKGSLGALLQSAKTSIDYVQVFAVTLGVVLLSILFENLLKVVWRIRIRDQFR